MTDLVGVTSFLYKHNVYDRSGRFFIKKNQQHFFHRRGHYYGYNRMAKNQSDSCNFLYQIIIILNFFYIFFKGLSEVDPYRKILNVIKEIGIDLRLAIDKHENADKRLKTSILILLNSHNLSSLIILS